jgi:dihydrofolate reductase
MKVILVFVATVDGKITKWGKPHIQEWSSMWDKEYFHKLRMESELIIMGKNTFMAEPIKPVSQHQIVVMTRSPAKYKDQEIPGQLVFSDRHPREHCEHFNLQGFKKMLVVGGPQIATLFLRENLVDEIWLTIEPLVFGSGGSLVNETKLDIRLQLLHYEKVNEQGTLITKYSVIKDDRK